MAKIEGATPEQMIDHIVASVPKMTGLTFKVCFGPATPPKGHLDPKAYIEHHRAHARRTLESDFLDLEVLYDDIDGNDELVSLEELEEYRKTRRGMSSFMGQMDELSYRLVDTPTHLGKGHQGAGSF